MAFTFTLVKKTIDGNERSAIYNVTGDGTSAAVATPLGALDCALISPISMNSSTQPVIKINTTTASAAANGSVFVSGGTSGDNFFMLVYGKS